MNWKKARIGEICRGIYDGPHATPPVSDDGAIFLGISNITPDGHLDLSAPKYISENDLPKWTKRVTPLQGDIVFSYEATLNLYAIIPEGFRGCLGRRMALIRPDEEKVLGEFLYYYFFSDEWRGTIAENTVIGATVDRIPLIRFPDFLVSFPSLKKQKAIADILSTYDDLIENNQKQIKLLEEAAQRLYKEWFVDLRFPSYETTPIVDGIPEGWRKGKISDFVPTSSGGTPSRTHSEYYSDGTNLWVKTQELNDGFIFDTEEKITDDAIRNSSAKIIPQGSILMAMYGATIGKIGIAATELTCNQACCVFNLSKIKYATSYLYCWLKDNREFFISQGKGAAQPNLSQAMIKNFDVLIPTADILTTFSQVTDTLLELSAKLHLQNRGLIESRDRLLPKLMSGEIEV